MPARLCFSVLSPTRTLHLSMDDQDTRDQWMNGIIGLLKAYHRKPLIHGEVCEAQSRVD